MPLKGLGKKTEQAVAIEEDPLVLETGNKATKWADRVGESVKMILHVQHVLGALAKQVDECNNELNDIYEDANLISALRVADYRQKKNPSSQPLPLKKQRSKRESSAKQGAQQQVDDNSTEALVAAMDEKKRAKVSNTLVNFFRRGVVDSPMSVSVSPTCGTNAASPVSVENVMAAPPSACVTPNDGNLTQLNHLSCESNNFLQMDLRRSKDIPPELWEEISRLRLRRIFLEERLVMLTKNIDVQLTRFDFLVQHHSIASYAMDAMECMLQTIRSKKV